MAFVGKGGAGKSSVSGTVCRHLARAGTPVLALDVDTMPGMAYSLGATGADARLPAGIFEMVKERGWVKVKAYSPSRLVDRFALKAPDGVRLLELGKLPARVEPGSSVAFRYVMERFRRPGWALVADLAAGTRQPMFRWARFARVVVVVADSSAKSLMSARRLLPAATHLLANRVTGEQDLRHIRESVPLPLIGAIPYDEAVADADRQGVALIDFAPDSRAARAAGELAGRLLKEIG